MIVRQYTTLTFSVVNLIDVETLGVLHFVLIREMNKM